VRSRGWKRGLVTSLVAAACAGISFGLGEAGEALAGVFL
jgi:hypothetical protein